MRARAGSACACACAESAPSNEPCSASNSCAWLVFSGSESAAASSSRVGGRPRPASWRPSRWKNRPRNSQASMTAVALAGSISLSASPTGSGTGAGSAASAPCIASSSAPPSRLASRAASCCASLSASSRSMTSLSAASRSASSRCAFSSSPSSLRYSGTPSSSALAPGAWLSSSTRRNSSALFPPSLAAVPAVGPPAAAEVGGDAKYSCISRISSFSYAAALTRRRFWMRCALRAARSCSVPPSSSSMSSFSSLRSSFSPLRSVLPDSPSGRLRLAGVASWLPASWSVRLPSDSPR
mmetsp:Transcript_4341/g.11156  ORF Transcript_4341/g.11156 Transcript_4341/m.11156 type:complete len:297 (+) Transcript_4341:25-915(+)